MFISSSTMVVRPKMSAEVSTSTGFICVSLPKMTSTMHESCLSGIGFCWSLTRNCATQCDEKILLYNTKLRQKAALTMFRLSEKGEKIQQMFGTIAPRYDFLNRMLSFGIDRRWRKKAVRLLKYRDGARILDVATGTGDVALEIARTTPPSVKITGADFCKEMVELGRIKAVQSPYAGRID